MASRRNYNRNYQLKRRAWKRDEGICLECLEKATRGRLCDKHRKGASRAQTRILANRKRKTNNFSLVEVVLISLAIADHKAFLKKKIEGLKDGQGVVLKNSISEAYIREGFNRAKRNILELIDE